MKHQYPGPSLVLGHVSCPVASCCIQGLLFGFRHLKTQRCVNESRFSLWEVIDKHERIFFLVLFNNFIHIYAYILNK